MALKRSYMRSTVLLLLTLLLAACGSAYQVTRPDEKTGLLVTSVEVKPEEILTFKPLAGVDRINFVLLRAGSGGSHTSEYASFMKKSIEAFGIRDVVTRDEFTKLIINSPLRDSVGNVTDPVALARISSVIGPFIIIDAVQVFQGYAWFETRLRVTDASSAEVMLDIHRMRNNFSGLDREVNYPMLNVVKRWFDESRKLPPPEGMNRSDGDPKT